MHCNTEEDCTEFMKLLPQTQAALLDWAINLMADVVQHEQYNKMNARNVAMVFAPNMTQMADPLTALIHAVQVMNFLKTLILTTLRERDRLLPSYSPTGIIDIHSATTDSGVFNEQVPGASPCKEASTAKLLRAATMSRLECIPEEKLWSFGRGEGEEEFKSISGNSTPNACDMGPVENESEVGTIMTG